MSAHRSLFVFLTFLERDRPLKGMPIWRPFYAWVFVFLKHAREEC